MSCNSQINIAGRKIGPSHPPFIIAEMSGNHNQSPDRALAIVEAAAKAGAHAVKLQTYTADTMTLNIAEREFLSMIRKACGRANPFTNFTKRHTPRGSGINRFLSVAGNLA